MTSARISAALLLLATGVAQAVITDSTQQPLVEAALAEQAPMLKAPADFSVADYALTWREGSAPGLRAWLEPGSLHWVWAQGRFAVPRALLVVEAGEGVTGGTLVHGSFTHALDAHGRARIPVVLLSGETTDVRVSVVRGAEAARADGVLSIRFAPRPQHAGAVLLDSSCSSWGVHVAGGDLPPDSWMYVRCRVTPTLSADGRTGAVELAILWDGAGDAVELEGVPLERRDDAGIHHVKLVASPSVIRLSARGHEVRLGHRVPPRLSRGFVGVGVGPYLYTFHDSTVDVDTVAPLVTLYAGYSFEPDLRLVYFNATSIHRSFFMDQGLYLWVEQLRSVDDRLSVNLLLGLHVMMFESDEELRVRVSAPQGLELIYRDLFAVNRNFSAGAFLYPEISGRSYYNVWLRWGSPSIFGEFNWIEWKEPKGTGATESQSLGLTLGFPLFRFL